MIHIHALTFNDFQVNTYILWDQTLECIIIDAACYYDEEKNRLASFIGSKRLKPVKLVNTHNHVDHILGNPFVKNEYKIPLYAHKDGDLFIRMAQSSGTIFGLEVTETISPDYSLKEGDKVHFGNSELNVLYTPGHADGSICLYASAEKALLAGDVLFKEGIGRTDLPTGDFNLLKQSIQEKLYKLDNDVKVFPGHGPQTTIGHEKEQNPFITP